MALIDRASHPTILLEDHLFTLPPTATERLSSQDFEIGPAQAISDSSEDILFVIPPTHTEYTSLADVRFSCELVVSRPDGTALIDRTDTVVPVNNLLHSLFKSVTISLNGRLISDSSELYAMRAYLESLLGFSKQTQKSKLTLAGFYLDKDFDQPQGRVLGAALSAGANDTRTVTTTAPERRKLLHRGGPIQLSGKLHADLFQQSKPLITGVEVQIRMIRSKAAFAFCATTAADLPLAVIGNPKLRLRRFVPNPAFMNSVARNLLTKTVKYHINRTAMRSMTFDVGTQHCTWANVVIGQLPKMAIMGIVSNAGFSGVHDRSPFNFKGYDLSHIAAEIEGITYPSKGYTTDFGNSSTLSAYEARCGKK